MTKPECPKRGFTDNFIKGLPPPPAGKKDYTVFNGNGFGVRVSKTGKRFFVFLFRVPGQKSDTLSIGEYPLIGLHEARKAVDAARGLIERGINPKVYVKAGKDLKVESAKLTFGDLADEYLANASMISDVTRKDYRDRLYRYVFPSKKAPSKRPLGKNGQNYDKRMDYRDWSEIPAEDITRNDIRTILKSITANDVGRSANLTLTILKNVFKYGMQEELVESDPTYLVVNPAPIKRGTRFLDVDEIGTFWHGLLHIYSHQTILILRLLLLLARRETELCEAQWSEFDLDRGEWFIPITRKQGDKTVSSGLKVHKSNQHLVDGLMVALPKLAVDMLKAWKDIPRNEGYLHVFPSENDKHMPQNYHSLSRALLRNWKDMGLAEHITPHGLRRSAVTHMHRLGIEKYVIDRITAHTAGDSVEETYNRYGFYKEKLAAVETWSAEVQRLISAK